MLLVNNIHFNRQNKTILKDVNLSIPPKGIIHLTGNNGVGKTTLGRLFAKALNCTNYDSEKGETCNVCNNCLAIQKKFPPRSN